MEVDGGDGADDVGVATRYGLVEGGQVEVSAGKRWFLTFCLGEISASMIYLSTWLGNPRVGEAHCGALVVEVRRCHPVIPPTWHCSRCI